MVEKKPESKWAKEEHAIISDIEKAREDRMNYLLSQSKLFKHFIQSLNTKDHNVKTQLDDILDGQNNETPHKRMTEKEEDEILLKGNADNEFQPTRLTSQPSNITGKMRPYQIEGLNFLIGLHERGINGILADEMGLGKTLQTISLLGFLRQFKGINGPHLVITPKSTMGNWIREINRWCPDIQCMKFHGNQDERKEQKERIVKGDFDVVVTSYEVVIREKTTFQKFYWRYVIIDEAHRIKNEESILSQIVRSFNSQNRLLITGTPLQNNLRELWALLNFLLPDIFSSADNFDAWFSKVETTDDDSSKKEVVHQLHSLLRPFLIRRLKAEVEHSLPPKKETVLFTRLTTLQLDIYRNLLKKDIDAINGTGGDKVRLLNILMQLRKCCNHPYLFDGAEDRSLDPFGEHLIENCGKLRLLDKLLPRLKADGHRVLIFSQMTRVLDILEDYCCEKMRNYSFCRIDGQTDGETRDDMIDAFNAPDSDKFIFLLSTRAGGLGINLATADTVILYDSDWNPQVDLQAMDRAHRIGQKKPVNVYRLITEKSVEERIMKKALEKLRLDTLVIQQGRLVEQKKNLQKNELLDMIRFGADTYFKADEDDYQDEELEIILSRGEQRTNEINKEMAEKIPEGVGLNMLNFKLSDDQNKTIYEFDGVDYTDKKANPSKHFFLDMGKRSRTKNYDEAAYFREALRVGKGTAEKKHKVRVPKEPNVHDFQFFNVPRIRELVEKERSAIESFNRECETAQKNGQEEPSLPSNFLNEEDAAEKEALLNDGFSDWTRREFNAFLRGCERHGRDNLKMIAEDIGPSKTLNDVKAYSEAFWKYGPTLIETWSKILKNIEDGEAKIARRQEMERAIHIKCKRYKDPWRDLEIIYAGSKGKTFNEEEDRWLVCSTRELGYGLWDEMKLEARKEPLFRFDWFMKSRTPLELKRRVDVLIRAIEKENEELLKKEQQAEKRKKENQRRKSLGGDGGESLVHKSPSAKGKKGSGSKVDKGSKGGLKRDAGQAKLQVQSMRKKSR